MCRAGKAQRREPNKLFGGTRAICKGKLESDSGQDPVSVVRDLTIATTTDFRSFT
jgi:hypothetical protein